MCILGVERDCSDAGPVELEAPVLREQLDLDGALPLQEAKLVGEAVMRLEVVPDALGHIDGRRLVSRRPRPEVEVASLPDTPPGGVIRVPVRVEAGADPGHFGAVELLLGLLRRVDQHVRAVDEHARPGAGIGHPLLARLDAHAAAASGPRDRHGAARTQDLDPHYVPIGCQTVFSSRNAEISYRLCASGAPSTTRFTFSAAARSRSARNPSAPVRSIALTSM